MGILNLTFHTDRKQYLIGRYVLAVFLVLLVFSCNKRSDLEKEIGNIPMDVEIVRFDKDFAAATPHDLEQLKAEYPLFFPTQYNDSVWIEKLTDTLQAQLEKEVFKSFPDNSELENILVPLFQHIKYYFPKFEAPQVITTTSDVDYRNRVILTDSLLVIALDTYLGSDHKFYSGIDRYISKEMEP